MTGTGMDTFTDTGMGTGTGPGTAYCTHTVQVRVLVHELIDFNEFIN